MGLLRRHDDAGGTRYQMREKLFAIGALLVIKGIVGLAT